MTDLKKLKELLELGRNAYVKGDYQKAEQYYTESIARGPQFVLIYLRRASVYCQMRNANMYKADLQKFCAAKLNWPKKANNDSVVLLDQSNQVRISDQIRRE